MSLYTALYTLQSLTVQRHLPQAIIVVLCTVVVVIDQTPSTMLLPNLKKSVVEATPHTWPEGLLLSQSALPSDVTAVRGLMDVIPGYGRWATSNANQVVIEFAKPVPPQLTLHIRVKSASDHSNFVLPIRLGNTTQRITLSDTIQEFIIPFHTDGTATQLVLDVGTSNSNDRGEVFVQSLWADVP